MDKYHKKYFQDNKEHFKEQIMIKKYIYTRT